MSPKCIATVLYPKTPDSTFDMTYYTSTHMPLVQKHWSQYGLLSWKSLSLETTLAGDTPPYSGGAILIFKDRESAKTAFDSPEAKEVFGDVPKFSNKGPLLMYGDITAEEGGA